MKDFLSKVLKYIWVAVGIALGVAIAQIFLPSKTVYVGKPYPVKDSLAVSEAIERAVEIRSDSVSGFWERFWKLKLRPVATGYYAMPATDPYPPRELKISAKDSTIISGVPVPAIDAPISLEADRSTVTITTRNEWLRSRGEPFVKVYQWDRLAPDFFFALNQTTAPDRLDGINLYFKRRAIQFDGFGLFAGARFPEIPFYAGIDARFVFWERLELSPRLSSEPSARLEARWRF